MNKFNIEHSFTMETNVLFSQFSSQAVPVGNNNDNDNAACDFVLITNTVSEFLSEQ